MSSTQKIERRTTRSERQTNICEVFGAPKEHIANNLPTYNDNMKYYLLIRDRIKVEKNGYVMTLLLRT